MHTISATHAKTHLSKILNKIVSGEQIIVTRRGQPIARIVAIKKQLKPLSNMKKWRAKFPKIKISSLQLINKEREE